MNKIASVVAMIIILTVGYFVLSDSKSNTSVNKLEGLSKNVSNASVENSEMKDGFQYITITANGGYSPKVSSAKAGIKTKLIIKTNGTYDCSASLVIKSLKYREILPNTGETVVDVGIPNTGDILQGVCSMGMYSFLVKFG